MNAIDFAINELQEIIQQLRDKLQDLQNDHDKLASRIEQLERQRNE